MTQAEITNKSNLYKMKLSDCDKHIDGYYHSIDSFQKFKNYLEKSNKRAKKMQRISLISSCLFGVLALATVFSCVPIGIAFVIVSAVSLERFVFFEKVTKKFSHCINYLSRVIRNLSSKKSDYMLQREFALGEIIKLEKTIPETISSYLENECSNLIEEDLEVCGL